MRVIVSQKNLRRALRVVERVVSKNVSLPILNNICLKTENGRVKVLATNLEIGITASVGAKIEEPGQIAIPGRMISDFVNNLTEENITLTVKNNSLFVNSEHYKTQILGFDAKEYPIIPKLKTNPLCYIPAQALKSALVTVFDSIAVSEARPELAGLLLNFSEQKVVFASTDSFRLTEKKISVKSKENQSVIVPRNTVTELIRLSSDIDGDIEVRISDGQICFSTDDVEIVSRLIEGNYPDYTRVIPDKNIAKALISKNELERNIRLAGLFSSNIADIKLSCEQKRIHISAKNSDKGEIQTSVEAVLKNEPFEASLNFNYLLDGLKALDTDKIIIEFTGVGSPLVMKPNDETKNALYLIMPLRN